VYHIPMYNSYYSFYRFVIR